jgi:hypothetical protein
MPFSTLHRTKKIKIKKLLKERREKCIACTLEKAKKII